MEGYRPITSDFLACSGQKSFERVIISEIYERMPSKMECFVKIVDGFRSLTIFTKHSISCGSLP